MLLIAHNFFHGAWSLSLILLMVLLTLEFKALSRYNTQSIPNQNIVLEMDKLEK